MFFSSPVDKRDTEHEFCEMLLKEVTKTSLELAKQLRKQLEATESPLTMEELLVRLEGNELLMESLEVESTAAGKDGGAKHWIRKVNNLLQIQRFNSNQSAHPAEVNTMFHSARKRKHDCRTKPSSGVRNCRVPRDHQGAEISNLIKDKLQKQEMMTLDVICVAHLDEDNG